MHEFGRVEFVEAPGGTHVTWTTVFGLKNPVLRAAEPAFAAAFRVIFEMTLSQVAKRSIAAAKS